MSRGKFYGIHFNEDTRRLGDQRAYLTYDKNPRIIKAMAKQDRHDALYQRALEALNRLFSDTTVDQGTTAGSLRALRDELDICLEALRDTET